MPDHTANVLFVTTHKIGKKGDTWNDELLEALESRGASTTTLSLLEQPERLTGQDIAQKYTHVCFLLLGEYPPHQPSLVKFLKTALTEAKELNPGIRILNDHRIIEWNSDKKYLQQLTAAEFPIPVTTVLNARQPLEYLKMAIYAQSHGHGIVVKPSISASGACTHFIDNPQQLSNEDDKFLAGFINVASKGAAKGRSDLDIPHGGEIFRRTPSGKEEDIEEGSFGSIMLQEYIPEIEQGEYSLCFVGGNLLYTVLKTPRRGGWQVGSEFGGAYVPLRDEDVPTEAVRVANGLLKWIGGKFDCAVDYARVDGVLRDDGGFVLMEVELIEPSLFLMMDVIGSLGVDALCKHILQDAMS